VGAKLDRLQAAKNHWDTFKTNLTGILTETEDADITATLTEFNNQKTCYEAALAVSATLMETSLIDFLS
jgi:flagellar hook-associated protein 3 FlgL